MRGSLSSLLQLQRKPTLPAENGRNHEISPIMQDDAHFTCSDLRANSSLPSQLEKHHETPTSIGDEAQLPCSESREIPCSTRRSKGVLTSLRQYERLPEVLGSTQEETSASRGNSRKTTMFPLQREMRSLPTAAPLEQSRVPPWNTIGGLTSFGQLKSFPEVATATQESPRVAHLKLR